MVEAVQIIILSNLGYHLSSHAIIFFKLYTMISGSSLRVPMLDCGTEVTETVTLSLLQINWVVVDMAVRNPKCISDALVIKISNLVEFPIGSTTKLVPFFGKLSRITSNSIMELAPLWLYTSKWLQLSHDVAIVCDFSGNDGPEFTWKLDGLGRFRVSFKELLTCSVHLRLNFGKTWICLSLPLSLWKLLRKHLALYYA